MLPFSKSLSQFHPPDGEFLQELRVFYLQIRHPLAEALLHVQGRGHQSHVDASGPRGIRFGLIPVGRLSDQLVELVIRQVLVGLPGIRDETPQTPLLGFFFQLALGILGLAGRIPICQ